MFDNLREDLRLNYARPVGLWRAPIRFFWFRGFRATCIYRMARWFHLRGWGFFARVCVAWNENMHACLLNPAAEIAEGFLLPHGFGVVIGPGVKIAKRSTIFENVVISALPGKGAPVIGKYLVANSGAKILGPLTIGDNVTIGAMSVIHSDVASDVSVFVVPRQMTVPNAKAGAISQPEGSGNQSSPSASAATTVQPPA